jgi:myo-inositol 2-dehydrogenase/D-chiro-inositol 1-dehydrogenase
MPPGEVRRLAAEAGVTIVAINALRRFDDWCGQRPVEALPLLGYAYACGAEGAVLVPSDDGSRPDRLLPALEALQALLGTRGLIGLIEPIGLEASSLRSKADALAAISTVGGGRVFRLLHDTFHHFLSGEKEIYPRETGLVHVSGVDDPGLAPADMRDGESRARHRRRPRRQRRPAACAPRWRLRGAGVVPAVRPIGAVARRSRPGDPRQHRTRPERPQRRAGLIALAFAPAGGHHLPPARTSREERMTVRFGLLGAGRIGKVHARAITGNPDARLVAVADVLAPAAEAIAKQVGAEVRTIEAIEAAGDVDAVVICTPTDTHADLIERFARAGKAIFCEKPVDLDVGRVRACLAVVAETGTKLMVGFNRRFDPHFRAVHAAIAEGKIGKVEMVNIVSRDPGAPPVEYIRRSGGIFRDMTIHDFDMARWLLGEEPAVVAAFAANLVDREIGRAGDVDSVNVLLETRSGRQAVISNSRRATYGYDQRVEVLGSGGMVAVENQREVSIELATGAGFTRPPLLDFFMSRYTAAYAAEIAAFVAGVRDGAPLAPTGEDGLKALVLAEAAVRSVAEGRKIRVSEVLA